MKSFHVGLAMCCVLLTWLAACKVEDDPKGQVVKVEPEFTIEPMELLGQQTFFAFRIQSIDLQPCDNYGVDAVLWQGNGQVNLVIKNLITPENCNPIPAKAADTALMAIPDPGTYFLQITLKDAIFNQGLLEVTPEKYTIQLNSQNGFHMLHNELYRIPTRTIWGYVGYENKSEGQPYADQFLSDLDTLTTDALLSPGFYGHFIVNSNSVNLLPPPQHTYFKPFVARLESSTNTLKDLIALYRDQVPPGIIEIVVFTWEGKRL